MFRASSLRMLDSCSKNSVALFFFSFVCQIPSEICSALVTNAAVDQGVGGLFTRYITCKTLRGNVCLSRNQIWWFAECKRAAITLKRAFEVRWVSWLTLTLSLISASGASVVAIDNKIEQAMVSCCFLFFFSSTNRQPIMSCEVRHILCKPLHSLVSQPTHSDVDDVRKVHLRKMFLIYYV